MYSSLLLRGFVLTLLQDMCEEDIKSITPAMIHGQVDTPCVSPIYFLILSSTLIPLTSSILQTSATGDIDAYILCPTCVHGRGSGPITRPSAWYKLYVSLLLAQGGPFVVGEGTNELVFVCTFHTMTPLTD